MSFQFICCFKQTVTQLNGSHVDHLFDTHAGSEVRSWPLSLSLLSGFPQHQHAKPVQSEPVQEWWGLYRGSLPPFVWVHVSGCFHRSQVWAKWVNSHLWTTTQEITWNIFAAVNKVLYTRNCSHTSYCVRTLIESSPEVDISKSFFSSRLGLCQVHRGKKGYVYSMSYKGLVHTRLHSSIPFHYINDQVSHFTPFPILSALLSLPILTVCLTRTVSSKLQIVSSQSSVFTYQEFCMVASVQFYNNSR